MALLVCFVILSVMAVLEQAVLPVSLVLVGSTPWRAPIPVSNPVDQITT